MVSAARGSLVEGYVLASYGAERYLRHAVASVTTLRRYDRRRPVALYCPPEHAEALRRHGLEGLFDRVEPLPEAHRSIVGFKHHLDRFFPFDRTLWLDADTVWCRDPEGLWEQLRPYAFTATGLRRADVWFGASKGLGVVADVALRRRARTLRRFGLTELPRVQSGLMAASDRALTRRVGEAARGFLQQQDRTHFRSRLREPGRALESCEWSLAMAMSALRLPVLPWRQGPESPQVDFFEAATDYDPDFRSVRYRYLRSRFLHELQSVPDARLRRLLVQAARAVPGAGTAATFTPYLLHFGWLREKRPFEDFADRTWQRLTAGGAQG